MIVGGTLPTGLTAEDKNRLIEARAHRIIGVLEEFPGLIAIVEQAVQDARQKAIQDILSSPSGTNDEFKAAFAREMAAMAGATP